MAIIIRWLCKQGGHKVKFHCSDNDDTHTPVPEAYHLAR